MRMTAAAWDDGASPGLVSCRACGFPLEEAGLVLGPVPICNRFTARRDEAATVELTMTMCRHCRLVQLREAPAPSLVMPRVPWIRYNEPEAHLDDVAEHLQGLLTRVRGAEQVRAIGLGPFEAPLLMRLARNGATVEAADLLALVPQGSGEPGSPGYPYLETWQACLDTPTLSRLAATHGAADIVSCRYLLEHCHDPCGALRALGALLRRDGLLILEVPDSSKFLAARDYGFPWEEHVGYFVEETFIATAARGGYAIMSLLRYPGRLEDALVGVFRLRAEIEPPPEIPPPEDLFSAYRDLFPSTRAFVQDRLAALAGPDRDGIALFGAGHQASMWASAFQVGALISTVVDDDPNKRGLYPPGFEVPLTTTADLMANPRVTTCLLAVNPNSEPRVREKLAPLAARGVQFRSIYAGVAGSILEDSPSWP